MNKMERFFPALLDKFITLDFLEKVRIKYHFGEEQTDEIQAVAEEMRPVIREEGFWIRQAYLEKIQCLAENSDIEYENVAMSLGRGVDLLQERYCENGLLLKSYIVEALASELLMQGYDAYNRYISAHTEMHVARYHFPGSEDTFPLDMLPGILENLTFQITCNAAFCMQPKKSVVFISELTQDEKIYCQGICAECTNQSCPNRINETDPQIKRMSAGPLSYGYSRILGK